MNIFKRALKKGKQAVGSISKGISQLDPTYSKGLIGRYTAPIAKPVVASTTMVLTGGSAALVRPDLVKPAIQGFQMGAALGGAARAGGLSAIEAGANVVSASYSGPAMTESGAIIGEGAPANEPLRVSRGATATPLLLLGGLGLLAYLLIGKKG